MEGFLAGMSTNKHNIFQMATGFLFTFLSVTDFIIFLFLNYFGLKMSTDELKDAVKEMLNPNEQYHRIKAELMGIIFDKMCRGDDKVVSSRQPEDIALADALIVEYLMWRGCQHACNVFKTEGSVGPERMRKDLLRDLNVPDVETSTNHIPILLGILQLYKDDGHTNVQKN